MLDHLLTENELTKLLKTYLIACKVESKSPSPLVIYSRVVSYFVQFAQANSLPQGKSGMGIEE